MGKRTWKTRLSWTIPIAAIPLVAAIALAGPPSAAAAVNPDVLRPAVAQTYCGNNTSAVNITPAAGFNPLTATAAELSANGYPDRPAPSESHALILWRAFVTEHRNLRSSCARLHATGRKFAPTQPSPRQPNRVGVSGTSHNWSGYALTAPTAGKAYSDIEAQWEFPQSQFEADNQNSYSSSWVGMGGAGVSDDHPLVQAGTESDYVGGYPVYYLWYEVVPEESQVQVFTIPETDLTTADVVGVNITWGTKPKGCTEVCATIHIWDLNSKHPLNTDYYVQGHWDNDGQAEWIYERTCLGSGPTKCKFPYLANAAPKFTSAQVYYLGSWYSARVAVGSFPYTELDMNTCNNKTTMAVPESLAGGDLFMEFKNKGDNDSCGLG